MPKFTDASWIIGVLAGFVGGIAAYELGTIGFLIGMGTLAALIYLGPTAFTNRPMHILFAVPGFVLGVSIILGVTILGGATQTTVVVGGSLLIFVVGGILNNAENQ